MASIHSEPRLATEQDLTPLREIDGLPIPETVAPETPAEVASILADAGASGLAVIPIGGGTKQSLGNIPQRLDLGLSILRLNQIHHYEPTDMTLSVGAGALFGDVQALLAERGQTIPIETADEPRATIGGLIATAFAGPRRLGSGTLRDLLIGISVAYPNGTIGKAGGLVVKNVTGFDLMRLHLGALGTLGVILSANFKVLPLARTEATLISEPSPLDKALLNARAIRTARLRPIAIEVFSDGSQWRTAARFEGRAETVALGLEPVWALGDWEQEQHADESRAWWRRYVERQSIAGSNHDVMIRCGSMPKAGDELARSLVALFESHDISPKLCAISTGLGAIVLRFGADRTDAAAMYRLQQALLGIASSVMVVKAPPALKADIDIWGAVPETVSVMRALKTEFDPNNVLNPGRFVDRI